MIKQLGAKMIELEKIKDSRPKVKDMWCEEQQHDINRMFELIEDLIESAVCSNTSPMAYQQLQNTKEYFLQEFVQTSLKYRLIDKDYCAK